MAVDLGAAEAEFIRQNFVGQMHRTLDGKAVSKGSVVARLRVYCSESGATAFLRPLIAEESAFATMRRRNAAFVATPPSRRFAAADTHAELLQHDINAEQLSTLLGVPYADIRVAGDQAAFVRGHNTGHEPLILLRFVAERLAASPIVPGELLYAIRVAVPDLAGLPEYNTWPTVLARSTPHTYLELHLHPERSTNISMVLSRSEMTVTNPTDPMEAAEAGVVVAAPGTGTLAASASALSAVPASAAAPVATGAGELAAPATPTAIIAPLTLRALHNGKPVTHVLLAGGVPVVIAFVVSGGVPPYGVHVSDVAELPPGLAFSGDQQSIVGAPVEAGVWRVFVSVIDTCKCVHFRDVSIAIVMSPPKRSAASRRELAVRTLEHLDALCPGTPV